MKALLARLLLGGAGVAGGFPIWLWVIGGLLVALGGVEMTRRLQVATLESKVDRCLADRNAEKAAAANTALRQAAANARETQRRLTDQQEVQHAHDTELAAAVRDRDAARGASLRLSRQLAAFAAAHRGAASHPGAGGDSAPAGDPIGVLADLLGRIDARAGVLADYADAARIAGKQCEASYDALTARVPR